jgi:hypothetical protein
MEPPKIDLTDQESVMKELADDDRWVKEEFFAHLSPELENLADQLAKAFVSLAGLNQKASDLGTVQSALVAGFAFGVVDDVLTSTKLLISGKLMASGNLMRQAIEGVAVAVLCSSHQKLVAEVRKNKSTTVIYWQRLRDMDDIVETHKALAQLMLNQITLGIDPEAVARLKRARKHYHQFSHPGLVGIASRVSLGQVGLVYAGGHFDIEKLDGYLVEIRERIGLCSVLPRLIDALALRLAVN